jgi:hypothetical protein
MFTFSRRMISSLLVAALLGLFAARAAAQSANPAAILSGVVSDPAGAVVSGATLSVAMPIRG